MTILYKIKPGKKEQWLDWCRELSQHETAAVLTIKEEGLSFESCRMFGDYVIFELHEKGEQKSSNKEYLLNQTHIKNLQECLEPIDTEKLYEFSA